MASFISVGGAERLYRLTEGGYQNISLLPVLFTDSLNSLVEALLLVTMLIVLYFKPVMS